ncbi:MAG TPA: hypothetical protein VML55_09000 [Planctomycetaceae bacterium]|nr:hypothetical protein [Planctomycetaceae bacterium]
MPRHTLDRQFTTATFALAIILGAGTTRGLHSIRAEEPANASPPKFEFTEDAGETRVFRVNSRLDVTGELETALGPGRSQTLPLDVQATHVYRECRLEGTGRGPETLRSLRDYERAEATIKVDDQTSSSRLRDDRRLIVASGRREGVSFYSPAGTLRASELDLLRRPGDSLAVLGLLPLAEIEVGGEWTAESWVAQTLTGTEAVLASDLTCKLESAADGVARVTFQGTLEGATEGTPTKIELSGSYRYDLQGKFLTRLELTQKEQRAVGAVSPGLDVTARITLDRTPSNTPGRLTETVVAGIPLEPEAALVQLSLDLPWNARLRHSRDWHVFHVRNQVAVLRLLDEGRLVAQCNITPVATAGPGRHTPEDEFQADIRTALGTRFKEIEQAGKLEGEGNRYVYRVTVRGEANGLEMHWLYYLVAAPSGRQVSFVFAVETPLRKELGERDREIVESLEFVE